MYNCTCCKRHQTNLNIIDILVDDDLDNKYKDKINNPNKYKCRCNCRHSYRSNQRYKLFLETCNNNDFTFNTIAYSMVHPLTCTCCDRHCRDRNVLNINDKKPNLMQQYYGMCNCNCRHIIRQYERIKNKNK